MKSRRIIEEDACTLYSRSSDLEVVRIIRYFVALILFVEGFTLYGRSICPVLYLAGVSYTGHLIGVGFRHRRLASHESIVRV